MSNTDHNLSFRQKFLDKVQPNFINIISTNGLIPQLNWIDTLGSSTIEYYPSLSSYLYVTSALTKYFNYTPITIDSQRPSEYEILQFYVELFVSIKPKRIPPSLSNYFMRIWNTSIYVELYVSARPYDLRRNISFPLSLILSIVFLNLYHHFFWFVTIYYYV